MLRSVLRVGAIGTLACGAWLAFGGSALAATQLDETFAPEAGDCGNATFIVTVAPAGKTAAAPFAGVLTSWSYQALTVGPQMKLKVLRPAGGNSFTIVAESSVEVTAPNVVNTFPTRMSVQAGDIIGFYLVTQAPCLRQGAPATGWHGRNFAGDAQVGSTYPFGPDLSNVQYEISALLEPDADNDGFGDETQDCAPTDASRHDDCGPPETTITKHPKDKTRKKTAVFEFSTNEPGATFECSLDGAAFAPCTSPDTLKVKKGKHSFEVRARDAAGNVDGSPATDDWKVKKKKRK